MQRNMNGLSGLLLMGLALLFAALPAHAGAAAISLATEAGGVPVLHRTGAKPASAKKHAKTRCTRALTGLAPGPCSIGFAVLIPVPEAWTSKPSLRTTMSLGRWCKSFRPTGLLDPPRLV